MSTRLIAANIIALAIDLPPQMIYSCAQSSVFILLQRPSWDSDDDCRSNIAVWREDKRMQSTE